MTPGLCSRLAPQRMQGLVRDRNHKRAAGTGLEHRLGRRAAAARPDQLEVAEPGPAENLRERGSGLN